MLREKDSRNIGKEWSKISQKIVTESKKGRSKGTSIRHSNRKGKLISLIKYRKHDLMHIFLPFEQIY